MILVTGATGFLGKRICRMLDEQKKEYVKTSLSLGVDLRDEQQTMCLFEAIRPEYVLNCASYVGGLQFGLKHMGEMYKNGLLMQVNLLEACRRYQVKRLVNPISNCAYPGQATFFKEGEFWDGPLHESVMVYGMVRKMSYIGSVAYQKQYGVDTINLILSNMYGPEDHFEEERSHALGALVMKFVDAKEQNIPEVCVWGTGKPVREWLYVDDGAKAMIKAIDIASEQEPINIGLGKGISVSEMAEQIKSITGYSGKIVYDTSKEDGAPYKTVDGSKGERLLAWKPEMTFKEGLRCTIEWYQEHRRQSVPIREVKSGGVVLARLIRPEAIHQGLNFFSQDSEFIQVGAWQYEKGKDLLEHIHNQAERTVQRTCETLYVVKGSLEARIYTEEEELIETLYVKTGEILILLAGGHGYTILDDGTRVIEIKNGPYLGADIDRRRF